MHAMDVVDNPLQWETERQNRIHQEALEQRKKLAAAGTGAGAAAGTAADPGQRSFLADADRLRYYWVDKVMRIPRIRSALIPLDETSEADSWSKPLSLKKADIEPFASFFRGYCRSRLFLEPISVRAGQIDSSEALQLDFPVRALFELRGFDSRFIFDPPVQIDAQIEFHDLEQDLRDCRDHARMRLLIEMAESTHDKQLEQAVARGREMGDALHDALMGEGHVNLIRAWERVHQRKPTIQELHLMLTTGRISVEQRQEAVSASGKSRSMSAPVSLSEERVAEALPRRTVPIAPRAAAPQAARIPAEPDVTEKEGEAAAADSAAEAKSSSSTRVRQVLLYLFHAAVGSAALAAYTWYF